jgi:Mg2+-importing ATPase
MENRFSHIPLQELFSQLNSNSQGLSSLDAQQILQKEPARKKTESRFSRDLKLLIRQFSNPLVFLLIAAVILAAILGETSDTIIILFILLATGLLSFFRKEMQAGPLKSYSR